MTRELVWSIQNGDLDEVKSYFDEKKIDVNQFIEGRAPIHWASDYGQREIIDFLIQKGAKIDLLDSYGISALLAAIWEGHTECAKLLLQSGAMKDGRAPDGRLYIEVAEKPEIRALLA